MGAFPSSQGGTTPPTTTTPPPSPTPIPPVQGGTPPHTWNNETQEGDETGPRRERLDYWRNFYQNQRDAQRRPHTGQQPTPRFNDPSVVGTNMSTNPAAVGTLPIMQPLGGGDNVSPWLAYLAQLSNQNLNPNTPNTF